MHWLRVILTVNDADADENNRPGRWSGAAGGVASVQS